MNRLNLDYKHYLLGLLTLVGVLNYLDRYVLALLLEPIKQDLELSDSQLGFLTGFAFALFYAVAGIPLARWADRGNRNTVVTVTTGLWSAMLALCGLASNYWQLLLARVGVAVGEAGCMPSAQSLIADYFDRTERPKAMAFYVMFGPIAIIAGYLLGGWLGEAFGWRTTFILIGLPGIAVALLVRFTVREPRLKLPAVDHQFIPLREVVRVLLRQKSFRHFFPAFCIAFFFNMGIYQWMPTFFIRSHGMSISEVGVWLAFSSGVCGIVGAYLGGFLASRYAYRKEALQMRFLGISIGLSGVLFSVGYLSSDRHIALFCVALVSILFGIGGGPVFAVLQSITQERMRAVTLALLFFFANLIGFGLGPWVTGILSDALHDRFGQESLRYALVILSPGYLWAGYHYWRVGDTVEEEIRAVESSEENTDQATMGERFSNSSSHLRLSEDV